MPSKPTSRPVILGRFESEAEMLVACQLDLLAQLEEQLRAVRTMLTSINALRSEKLRGAAIDELTNGQRDLILSRLSLEIERLDAQVATERATTSNMVATIKFMHAQIAELRALADATT